MVRHWLELVSKQAFGRRSCGNSAVLKPVLALLSRRGLQGGVLCVILTPLAVGCSMCDHPYDWSGPMYVGMPQPNCPPPPRAGSILDPRSGTVSMPTPKRKKATTKPTEEGKPAAAMPAAPASPGLLPKTMPSTEPTPTAQELPLPAASTAKPQPLAARQPPADALEMDASGWRAKPAGWSSP